MSIPPQKTAIDIVKTCADDLDWCMCMFFSVDIAGATAFKAAIREGNEKNRDTKWCQEFEKFYVEFPRKFFRPYVNSVSNTEESSPVKKPVLWKFVGDEILFYVPILSYSDTVVHIKHFADALRAYNAYLIGKSGKAENNGDDNDYKKTIRCKGTCWLAGFPLNNRIVLIPIGDSQELIIDFIGSSIDCGFRLTKFSTPRKLVVSFELIWILATAYKNSQSTLAGWMNFWFEGKHELKGVNNSRPYPVFWVDLEYDADSNIEDKWLSSGEKCRHQDIIPYCENFEQSEPGFIKPFISQNQSGEFNDIPQSFQDRKSVLKEYEDNNNRTSPSRSLSKKTPSSQKKKTSKKSSRKKTS